MANYINTTTNEYPVSETGIRRRFPNTSFPRPFKAPDEFSVVFPTPSPSPGNVVVQMVRETAPILTDKGHYEQAWEVVSRFQEYTDDQGVVHTVEEQEAAAIAAHLVNEKANKIKQINAKRDAMEQEGFAYAGHEYQSDPISTQRIANAALAATSALLTSQPFAVAWQTADNGVVELDANGMLAMQAALMQRAAALHYHARDLKAAINAAADLAALELIDTEAGWPPL